jgi:hypothetical protein
MAHASPAAAAAAAQALGSLLLPAIGHADLTDMAAQAEAAMGSSDEDAVGVVLMVGGARDEDGEEAQPVEAAGEAMVVDPGPPSRGCGRGRARSAGARYAGRGRGRGAAAAAALGDPPAARTVPNAAAWGAADQLQPAQFSMISDQPMLGSRVLSQNAQELTLPTIM